MRKYIVSLLLLVAVGISAQITTDPVIVDKGYTGRITITFDASKGNGGMLNAKKCYAHTGYCTPTQSWLGVKANWRASNAPKLDSLGNNKWQLVIDNMYTYYNIPAGTDVYALCFVFNDGPNGQKEGKTAGGTDIFLIMGQEAVGDIWEAVENVQPITGTRPAGINQGIYYGSDGTSVTLCTYAASKTQPAKRVFLLGDVTDWRLKSEYQMKRDGNYFWITLNDLEPGKEYRFQYAVERSDGVKKQICDIFSEKVLHTDDKWEPKQADPTLIDYPLTGADGGYVTVIQPSKPAYNWSDATLNFQRPDKNNLVIYELWVYDFTSTRTIEGVRQRLDYLKQLGVNAIELMPISEFEGNISWGYNPTLYFAPDRTYGSENDIKRFIDECHQHGIAVIVDMVFNHTTGQNPMAKLYPWGVELNTYNPWFVAPSKVKHSDNDYGEDWNHDFAPAHDMFTRVFKYWLTEYKVDGFRLDLSHGLCGETSYNAVYNLKDYYTNGVKAVSPSAYMILEHWGDHGDEDRPQLVNEGMLCWINTNYAYCQLAMGYFSDDNISVANRDGYVSYCESHDEERMQYKCKAYAQGAVKTDVATRVGRVPACVAMNVLLNGPHMLWQYEEIGYDYSIDNNGRTGIKPRPEPLGYFKDANRVEAYKKCAQAIQLRTQLHPEWFAGDPTASKLTSGKVRTVTWGSNVFVAANFDPSNAQSVTLPSGTWYDYYAGGTQASASYNLAAGEVKIFTGSVVALPEINLDLETLLPIENVQTNDALKASKIVRDGQVLILRGDKVYTITGMEIR